MFQSVTGVSLCEIGNLAISSVHLLASQARFSLNNMKQTLGVMMLLAAATRGSAVHAAGHTQTADAVVFSSIRAEIPDSWCQAVCKMDSQGVSLFRSRTLSSLPDLQTRVLSSTACSKNPKTFPLPSPYP